VCGGRRQCRRALAYLGCRAEVLTVDPGTLSEVLASIFTVGQHAGRASAAHRLVAALEARLDRVGAAVAGRDRPRVAVLEWTDPPFTRGALGADMVAAAGGAPTLGERVSGQRRRPGRRSPAAERTWWWSRRAVTTCPPRSRSPRGSGRPVTCRRRCRCGRWMPTPRPGPRLLDGKATTASLRAHLISVPARIATSGRRPTLHLPRNWPWETGWQQLFDAATATWPPTTAAA